SGCPGHFASSSNEMAQGVTCPSCETAIPQGARFCMSCGAALELSCPSCGTTASAGARFCMSCGAALGSGQAAAAPPAATAQPAPSVHSEERRTVTVLFADLSGYTAVAERLDAETV